MPATLTVYGLGGGLVRELVNGATGAGVRRVLWNSQDSKGRRVPPGVYYARLRLGQYVQTRRISVLR